MSFMKDFTHTRAYTEVLEKLDLVYSSGFTISNYNNRYTIVLLDHEFLDDCDEENISTKLFSESNDIHIDDICVSHDAENHRSFDTLKFGPEVW